MNRFAAVTLTSSLAAFLISVALGVTAARAQTAPDLQWKTVPSMTLATLVQSGYRIVAVTKMPSAAGSKSKAVTEYVLQKEASAFTCVEDGQPARASDDGASQFRCDELVQPYPATTTNAK
ncbi:hypothetical protein [Paraburkholderia sp.]|uniref:hypothetical protein n=1 Tax=Paraburkholderia sp. TaxID=1926495 RepID=UPI00238CC046|nr:hypothetical protein [Paraburkholderia sp.]MDE1182006.1 hypothetical protein [Paraburkholderia sp.]